MCEGEGAEAVIYRSVGGVYGVEVVLALARGT